MIPKIIHCFWAGGPKTDLARKCLASWRKYAPDWEIREWGLSDISNAANMPNFCREAIRRKKWAFVADWARFASLQHEGGLYFDFDVELVKPIGDLPGGEWVAGEWTPGGDVIGNPGSGIALEKGSPIARAMLDYYATAEFNDKVTVCSILSGLDAARELRVLDPEVMSPIDNEGRMHLTNRTVGIHWYAMSWASPGRKAIQWMSWHGMQPLINFLLRIKRAFVRR